MLDERDGSILPTTPGAAGIVERLDGKMTLRRMSAGDKARRPLCRELAELGALRFVD